MSVVELYGVSRTYQLGTTSIVAVRDISLRIEMGEFIAIWGPSGSGKSTLCNLIGGLDRPTAGSLFVNGKDLAKLTDDELSIHRNRSHGFVFQHFNLIPVLTAAENVALPLLLKGDEYEYAEQTAVDFLCSLGLERHIKHRPDKLSGGERQRVAIARALITNPSVVIADEPTANLDSKNALSIVNLMRQINLESDTTFIFATHDHRLLSRVERRIELRDGVISADTSVLL